MMDAWKTRLPATFPPRSVAQQLDLLSIRLAEAKLAVVEAAEDVSTKVRDFRQQIELKLDKNGVWRLP